MYDHTLAMQERSDQLEQGNQRKARDSNHHNLHERIQKNRVVSCQQKITRFPPLLCRAFNQFISSMKRIR
jgi:hypothetical protein